MEMTASEKRCIYCGQNSLQVPLLAVTYQAREYWICPQDLPILIHSPAKLAGKLPGVERLIFVVGHHPEDEE